MNKFILPICVGALLSLSGMAINLHLQSNKVEALEKEISRVSDIHYYNEKLLEKAIIELRMQDSNSIRIQLPDGAVPTKVN